MSANGDELQILVYDTAATFDTTGSDIVTVNVSNLPATLAGKELFVTHFRADETHSNPYSVWVSQNRPTAPTEAQWQAMKAHQHLELLSPVTKATVTTSYTTSFTIPRHAGSLVVLGVKRPVTGRNAFVEIEGEDYDGQSGVTKQDSGDTTTLGQSISAGSGAYAFYLNVDFSDTGVGAVQLRVNAQAATTLDLRADTATGPSLGTCQIAATGGAWATQTCTLTQTSGVHTLYLLFGGTVRLNHLKFQAASGSTGTGGTGGSTGAGGRGGSGGIHRRHGHRRGRQRRRRPRRLGQRGRRRLDGHRGGWHRRRPHRDRRHRRRPHRDRRPPASGPTGTAGTGVDPTGTGGSGPGTGGSSPQTGGSGCACDVGRAGGKSGTGTLLFATLGLAAVVSRVRRRQNRRR